MVTRILDGEDGLPDEWNKTAEMLRETAETVLGVTFGKRKEYRETWWWNEEVQKSIKEKKAKKAWDKLRDENVKKCTKKRRKLGWQKDVRIKICMLDWKQKKVKGDCTDWLAERQSGEKCTAPEDYEGSKWQCDDKFGGNDKKIKGVL